MNVKWSILLVWSSFFYVAAAQPRNAEISRHDYNPARLRFSNLLQGRLNQRHSHGKSLWGDMFNAYILSIFEKTSEFPTAFAPDSANISEQCRNDSKAYYSSYQYRRIWARQMYESSGKYPDGMFGNLAFHAFGLFDECLAIKADSLYDENTGEIIFDTDFRGQYCSVFIDIDALFPNETDFNGDTGQTSPLIPLPSAQQRDYWLNLAQLIQLFTGGPKVLEPRQRATDITSPSLPSVDFCIPSSCSVEDFRSAVASIIGKETFANATDEATGQLYFLSLVALASQDYCFTEESITATPVFDGPDIAVIATLSLLAFLVLLATLYEGWRQFRDRPIDLKKEGLAVRALHCFSLLNNGKKLLSTKVSSSDNLTCLNGIRVLSTTWVVMGHTYFQVSTHSQYNGAMLYKEAMEWQFHGGVTMATVAVDTFFLMSGLLVSYLLLRELDRNKGRFNVILFYVHRYLRLTPVYAVILGFVATLLVYTTTGPNWQTMYYLRDACRYNWWNNLLYVNNYVRTYPIDCMGETWYLACDMQMFLVSPLFIYPLWRWWKAGLAWTVFGIAALQGGLVAIFIIWDLPATSFATRSEMGNPHFYGDYYVQMWTRFPPYLFGILLGWILYRTKNSKVNMNKMLVATCWMLSVACGLAIAYGMVPYLNEETVPEMDDAVRVIFGAFNRLAWAVAVGWVIFACVHGYGGFVNRLMSWKAYIPLGRLTYVVYLIHFEYLYLFWAHARKPYYYTVLDHIQHYFGVLLMVFLLAFVISITIEAPFLNLEKLLFNLADKPVEAKKENNVDDWKIPRPRPLSTESQFEDIKDGRTSF